MTDKKRIFSWKFGKNKAHAGLKNANEPGFAVQTQAVQTVSKQELSLWECCQNNNGAERRLYQALREAVPIIDSAIHKLLRIIGSFTVVCNDKTAQRALHYFLEHVKVNTYQQGIYSFISCYFDQLLTYGTAVAEIVPTADAQDIGALYVADLDRVDLVHDDKKLQVEVYAKNGLGERTPVRYPELILMTALNPPHGSAHGVSVLRGLPFISEVLLKIYKSIGMNWERVGNVRFAVTYKPTADPMDKAYAKERAKQIATEWSRAMRSGDVSDFVAVGDVGIQVIGADNQILDSEVPVRQMMEQIITRLGLPPFILGLSWSSTERMSSQQADILTREMNAYRMLLNPSLQKICAMWLNLHGFVTDFEIVWDNITMQDRVDEAQARLKRAQAAKLEWELKVLKEGTE